MSEVRLLAAGYQYCADFDRGERNVCAMVLRGEAGDMENAQTVCLEN